MTKLRIPFFRQPCFVDGEEIRFNHTVQPANAGEQELLRSIFLGGVTTEDLAGILCKHGEGDDPAAVRLRLSAAFAAPDSLIGEVEVEVPDQVDIMLIEQGYGGVYVHTVELMKQLRQRWSCLLLSPVPPLFDRNPPPEVVTLEGLRLAQPGLSYLAWVQIVRTLVKRTRSRLLMIMHRSQSLFLFDLLSERKTVIYCDGFFDGAFRRMADFHLDDFRANRDSVLAEILYVTANGQPHFLNLAATPSCNVKMLMAGGFALAAAAENWCWGREQLDSFKSCFPTLGEGLRLALPFIDSQLFDPQIVKREPRVLFTTTMHNIDKKGLPELVRAMVRLPKLRARVVVRQPERLPRIPPRVAARMEQGAVAKDEMIRLYHSMWVNCRVSREESSPLSILESMICELPQIVSPVVAQQIPILEDGATGFVVDPDNTDRLVRVLQMLLDDPRLRDRMGRECRRRAMQLDFSRRSNEFARMLG